MIQNYKDLCCSHCKTAVSIQPTNTKTIRHTLQPAFAYNRVTCKCRRYVDLPPMVGVAEAEQLGCTVVWRVGIAPSELTEAYEAEEGLGGLATVVREVLSEEDEKLIGLFAYWSTHEDSVWRFDRDLAELLGNGLAA